MKNEKFLLSTAVALLLCTGIGFIDGAVVAPTAAATTVAAPTTTKSPPTSAAPTAAVTTAKAAATAAPTTTVKPADTTTLSVATTVKTEAATTTKAAAVTNATTAPVTTVQTTTKSVAVTTEQFIPVPESECHMPFWHNGGWHHTCVKYNDFGDYWCSLTKNFTKDEDWKRCRSADLKRFQCNIPFEFEGKNHTECLAIDPDATHGRGYWCAVVPKIGSWSATGTDWAYCEHKDATGVTYLKTVGVHHDIAAAEKAAGNVTTGVVSGDAVVNSTKDSKSPSKSLSGASAAAGGSGGTAAGLGAQATIGISVGVVCSVLAVVAVVAGMALRKRRRSGRDHKALLQTREKGTYGGMEASD